MKRGMTQLIEALHAMGLDGEIALADRWIKLQGERCAVYVVERAWGGGYYTWCEDRQARAVEFYLDPIMAIKAGLRRAMRPDSEHTNG